MFAALALALGGIGSAGDGAVVDEAPSRVVVLVVEGLDALAVSVLAEAGEMPHLAAMREAGGFTRLRTLPGGSPIVSSLALQTGCGPGHTGVFGYVHRGFGAGPPTPTMGHLAVTRRRAEELGSAAPVFDDPTHALAEYRRFEDVCEQPGYWDVAARAGHRAIVLRPNLSLDDAGADGCQVLAGLGYPCARGGIGEWLLYTTDKNEFDRPPRGFHRGLTGGTVFRVDWRDGRIDTALFGPTNAWEQERREEELAEIERALSAEDLGFQESANLQRRKRELQDRLDERTSVPLSIVAREGGVELEVGGVEFSLGVGDWSPRFPVRFEMNPELAVHATTRVKLLSLEDPSLQLLFDTLDVDPSAPPAWQPLSRPPGFAAELAEAVGSFETYGWGVHTMPLKDERVDVRTVIEDAENTLESELDLVHAALARDDWRLFVSHVRAVDRLQFVTGFLRDREHPRYEAAQATLEIPLFGERVAQGDALVAFYGRVDEAIGQIQREHLAPRDVLLVVSDRGSESFRREVDLNAWLWREGYLGVLEDARTTSILQSYADWSATIAYSMGFGEIFLNLEGREPEGIVAPSQAARILDGLVEELLQFEDPETGERVVADVHLTEQVFAGPFLDRGPDAIVEFAPGYRIGWRATGGGMRPRPGGPDLPVCVDNQSLWSADSASVSVDANLGFLASNRPLADPDGVVSVLQFAPTVLELLGVEAPEPMRGAPLSWAE